MNSLKILCLCVLLVPGMASAGTLHYSGSSTVGKFITDASRVYQVSSFEIDTIPESAGGEKCAAMKRCDMGGVARDVKQTYLDQGVVATLIGKDALAAIVHPDNPVRELRSEQLKAIFTGAVTNWSQLGGPDVPITPHIVKRGSATRRVFRAVILQGADYHGCTVTTPDARIVTEVAKDRGAIGQISFAFIKDFTDVRALVVDGQEPSVHNPDYPITRSLHIATHGEPAGEVKQFINWALSPDGQQVVKERFVGIR